MANILRRKITQKNQHEQVQVKNSKATTKNKELILFFVNCHLLAQ
jgi:hypothetical protein